MQKIFAKWMGCGINLLRQLYLCMRVTQPTGPTSHSSFYYEPCPHDTFVFLDRNSNAAGGHLVCSDTPSLTINATLSLFRRGVTLLEKIFAKWMGCCIALLRRLCLCTCAIQPTAPTGHSTVLYSAASAWHSVFLPETQMRRATCFLWPSFFLIINATSSLFTRNIFFATLDLTINAIKS